MRRRLPLAMFALSCAACSSGPAYTDLSTMSKKVRGPAGASSCSWIEGPDPYGSIYVTCELGGDFGAELRLELHRAGNQDAAVRAAEQRGWQVRSGSGWSVMANQHAPADALDAAFAALAS